MQTCVVIPISLFSWSAKNILKCFQSFGTSLRLAKKSANEPCHHDAILFKIGQRYDKLDEINLLPFIINQLRERMLGI